MRRFYLVSAIGIIVLVIAGLAQEKARGPYQVSKVVRVGGAGTFDTAFADTVERRFYIPRKGPGRITVFDLDTLEPAGEIPNAAANGVVVDPKSGHGFASSKPVVMWDAKTAQLDGTLTIIRKRAQPLLRWTRP
jgi:hypothetical protein